MGEAKTHVAASARTVIFNIMSEVCEKKTDGKRPMLALELQVLLYTLPRAAGEERLELANFGAEARSRPKEGHARHFLKKGLRARSVCSWPRAGAQKVSYSRVL